VKKTLHGDNTLLIRYMILNMKRYECVREVLSRLPDDEGKTSIMFIHLGTV